MDGVWLATPTLLTDRGEIDERGTRALVADLARHPLGGLWLLGSAGLGPILDEPVAVRLVEVVVDELDGRLPVSVGCSAESTARVRSKARRLADLPLHSVFCLPPTSLEAEPAELERFFAELADRLPHPVVIYNNAGVAAPDLPLEVAVRLAGHERIIAIKDSGHGGLLEGLIECFPADRPIWLLDGLEERSLASLRAGADGVVAALGVLQPGLMIDLVAAARAGDAVRADAVHARIMHVLDEAGWLQTSLPGFVRSLVAACELRGYGAGQMPAPFRAVDAGDRARARALVSA